MKDKPHYTPCRDTPEVLTHIYYRLSDARKFSPVCPAHYRLMPSIEVDDSAVGEIARQLQDACAPGNFRAATSILFHSFWYFSFSCRFFRHEYWDFQHLAIFVVGTHFPSNACNILSQGSLISKRSEV